MSFTTDIPSAIMDIIDDNKDKIKENDYIQMCNYLKYTFDKKNSLLNVIYEPNDRVIYNQTNLATVVYREFNTYTIKIDNYSGLLVTTGHRLSTHFG